MGARCSALACSTDALVAEGERLASESQWAQAQAHLERWLASDASSSSANRGDKLRCLSSLAACHVGQAMMQEGRDTCTKAILIAGQLAKDPGAPEDAVATARHCLLRCQELRLQVDESLGNLQAAHGGCGALLETLESFPAGYPQRDAMLAEVRQKQAELKAVTDSQVHGGSADSDAFADEQFTGCAHYKRRCQMYCPDCNLLVPCRLCHDDSMNHTLDRFRVAKIQCGRCRTDQAPSQACVAEGCGETFAEYYCDVCHLWMDKPNAQHVDDYIWHCDECGFCRVAALSLSKFDYHHCAKCNMCWQATGDVRHGCAMIQGETCPCCLEDLHSSTSPIRNLPCGHTIHAKCCQQMVRQRKIACPVCKKTFAKEMFFLIRREVELQQMPAEFADKKANILCNDCLEKNEVPLHFVAMECPNCNGFNTTQIESTEAEEAAADATDADADADAESSAPAAAEAAAVTSESAQREPTQAEMDALGLD